jgi:hypothetical protein
VNPEGTTVNLPIDKMMSRIVANSPGFRTIYFGTMVCFFFPE